jgi:hypothetical protein
MLSIMFGKIIIQSIGLWCIEIYTHKKMLENKDLKSYSRPHKLVMLACIVAAAWPGNRFLVSDLALFSVLMLCPLPPQGLLESERLKD